MRNGHHFILSPLYHLRQRSSSSGARKRTRIRTKRESTKITGSSTTHPFSSEICVMFYMFRRPEDAKAKKKKKEETTTIRSSLKYYYWESMCVYAHNTIDYFIASRFLCFTHNSLSSFIDSVKCVCFYVLFFANFIIIQYILCVCVWERVCDIIYFDVLFVQIEAGGFFLSSFIRHSMCTIYATYSLLLLSITDDFRCFLSFFSLFFYYYCLYKHSLCQRPSVHSSFLSQSPSFWGVSVRAR